MLDVEDIYLQECSKHFVKSPVSSEGFVYPLIFSKVSLLVY